MTFRKVGADEGEIIDVQPTVQKLGASLKCDTCGRKFSAKSPDDFGKRRCPECRNPNQ